LKDAYIIEDIILIFKNFAQLSSPKP